LNKYIIIISTRKIKKNANCDFISPEYYFIKDIEQHRSNQPNIGATKLANRTKSYFFKNFSFTYEFSAEYFQKQNAQ